MHITEYVGRSILGKLIFTAWELVAYLRIDDLFQFISPCKGFLFIDASIYPVPVVGM